MPPPREGRQVRQYRAGKRASLDMIQAARTAMVALAATYGGAALLGTYLGYGVSLMPDWGHEPRRELVIAGLVAAGASALLATAGWLATRWCENEGDDDPSAGAAEAA